MLGNKIFEKANHLGNVLVTLSDKKIGHDAGNGTYDYYTPDIATANDYYPFGMLMPGRKYSTGTGYRYGFNGKEDDDDVKGEGNQQDYGMRIYDTRIGRFLSVDPITSKYPELTPYQFASNNPIEGIDLDGLEFFSFKQYKQRTPLVLMSEKLKINTTNKPIALVFKIPFTTDLPKRLIDRYASESGEIYKLDQKETQGLNVQFTGIHGITKSDAEKADKFINSIKPGESKDLPTGYSILGIAGEAGTLNRFTINVKGSILKSRDGESWVFKGSMQFFDIYDFKTAITKKGQKPEEITRNAWGDFQTQFAEKYLPGKPFKVISEWIPVIQNNENFFDWFKDKKQGGIPNLFGKEINAGIPVDKAAKTESKIKG